MMNHKAIGAICAAIVATMLVSVPASARTDPHHGKKQVCKVEKKHGKPVRVCTWVKR
jgi:hypothetical protein